MSLILHPDPQHPEGGYAFLELPEGSLVTEDVDLSVMDTFSSRWLTPSDPPGAPVEIGNPNWQPQEHLFGPYAVYRHDGADWVLVGPEIVNKLDEYQPLRITVAGQPYDVTWPDTLPARAGVAGLGGLQPIRQTEDPQRAELRVVSDADAGPSDSEDTRRVVPNVEPTPDLDEQVRKSGSIWMLLLLASLVGVGVVLWVFWPDPVADVAEVPAPEPTPVEIAAEELCTESGLRRLGDFAGIRAQIATCGKDVSADTALTLIEDFAAQEDADALALFGVLYDSDETAPRIETLIGLTFEADAARAAEYYARALAAGSPEADGLLTRVCRKLASEDSTLARGAYDDFCS